MKAVSCRYFTAYGPRCSESHAVMAMLGRAYIDQNPFELWGNGTQIRNWTYVDDIVEGTIKAAETIDDGTGINIGTMERTSVKEAAELILQYLGKNYELKFLLDMPTGPLNRVADNNLVATLFDWKPKYSFRDGLIKTIEWYLANKSKGEVKSIIENNLIVKK